MTTIKVRFRESAVPGREGTLYYQVIHDRVVRQVNTGYKLYPHEWDAATATTVILPETGDNRRNYLGSLGVTLREGISRFEDIISGFERAGEPYTAGEVVKRFLAPPDTGGILCFANDVIRQLEQTGKPCTVEKYANFMRSFSRFLGGNDVPLDEVDSDLMIRYENFLKAGGVCPNTSSYYLRGMRAIYNRAVERDLTVQHRPFRHVYTGIDKTVKRAVPLKVIRRIRELDLRLSPTMDFARDMFLFSFYTRGMSFVDMAYLKKQDLRDGVLTYRRKKTGQLLAVSWESQMQEIIDKYGDTGTPYLLPVIRDMTRDARRQYINAGHLVNKQLKKTGRMLGLHVPLTMYVARHTWASIARSNGISLPVISEGMGHDSESTTRIYLASLDTSEIDKANRSILKML